MPQHLSPTLLAALSVAVLALGLLVLGAALISAELRRLRHERALDRALAHGASLSQAGDPSAHVPLGAPGVSDLPVHWLDTRLGRALVADEDRRLIDQCGFPAVRAQLIFLLLRLGLALLLPVVVYMAWAGSQPPARAIAGLAFGFTLGFMGPKWLLARRAAERREQVAQELPLFVDLLRLLQGVGLSLDQSLQIMATDFHHVLRVLGFELGIANRQYAQGRTREHSLQRLGTLHRNEDLASLVMLLVQVDRHGGAVQEPLRIFSERLRERRRMEMKERIGRITVKMTVIMVTTLLPALLVVTAGPGFLAIIRSVGSMR